MLRGCATQGPERVLQPLGQGNEALATEHHTGLLPAGERQSEMVEPVVEPNTGDGDGKFRGIGEVRQALLTGRMFLPEDHIPLRTVQRLPQAHAALQRAAQLSGELGMAPLHLKQHTDRPQSRCGPQHRHDLALPEARERVRTAPATWRAVLPGHPGIDIEPPAGTGAKTCLGRRHLAGVGSSVMHLQLRLLISDVCAGHEEALFWGVEDLAIPTLRHGVAGGLPKGTAPTPGSPTVGLRPTSGRPRRHPS
jgi:hypothetical protein